MRKIAAGLLTAGILLVAASPAMATKPDEDGFHKAVICHNVSHNPHAVSIDIAAVAGGQETKHGLLVLDADLNFVSFTPHDSDGHDQDFFLHLGAEVKPDDDNACQPQEPTTTTTQPPTTTTTEPPVVTTTTEPPVVTTTTQPPVVTTTTQPSVRTAEPVVTVATDPAQVEAVTLTQPVAQPAPIAELPHTGAASSLLARLGFGLGLLGLTLLAVGKRRTVNA